MDHDTFIFTLCIIGAVLALVLGAGSAIYGGL